MLVSSSRPLGVHLPDPKISKGLWWPAVTGLVAFTLLVIFFAPTFAAYRAWGAVPEVFGEQIEVRRGASVVLQVEAPGRPIEDPIHKIIRWRLLFPGIGYALRLPAGFVLSLAHIGCLLALIYCAFLHARMSEGPTASSNLAFTILLGGCSWFMTSMAWLGYFDSWLALGMLVVAFSPARWAVAAASLLTPWIDERFVLGLPMCLLVRLVQQDCPLREFPSWALREAVLPCGLVAGYLAVRLNLQNVSGTNSVGGYFSEVAFFQIPWARHLLGVWEGLRLAWVPLLAGILLLIRNGRLLQGVFLGLGVASTVLLGLATANDLSRSMVLLLPAAAVGIFLVERWAAPAARVALPVLALAMLALPAHHVVSDFTRPMRGIWEELRRLQNPPNELDASYYLTLASLQVAEGNVAQGRSFAALARKMSPFDPDIAVRAALISYKTGDLASAESALDDGVRLAPDRSDIRLARGEVTVASGRAEAAQADLVDALESPHSTSATKDRARALLERIGNPAAP